MTSAGTTLTSTPPQLPWLAAPLAQILASQRGHALLVQAAAGNGAQEFGLLLAQAWLCEASAATLAAARPCGRCGSCKLVQSQLHPDLFVLLPETLRRAKAGCSAERRPTVTTPSANPAGRSASTRCAG
jgi:hypothetical protein